MSLSVIRTDSRAPVAPKLQIGLNENALILFGAVILLLGAVLWSASGPQIEKTDFSITYVGARIVHDGHGAKLYDLREQASVRDSLYTRAEALIYEHPPFEAFVLAPIAALPYRTAYLVWAAMNAAIWLIGLLKLRPYASVPKETLGYFALWFLFAPLGVSLYQGQSSLVLLFLYALTFISLKRGNDLRAGLYLGLGLFKFQFVLPFALIFLLRRQWKFLYGFALSAAVLGVFSLAAVGWRGIWSYVELLIKIAGNPDNASFGKAVGMATVQGFVYAVLGHRVSAGVVSACVIAISAVLVLVTAWRWDGSERERGEHFDLMFAAALIVSLVTGFHMFTHDLSPLLLAMLLVAAHIPRRISGLSVIVRIALAILWIPPVYFVLLAVHRTYLLFPILALLAIAAIWRAGVSSIESERNHALA